MAKSKSIITVVGKDQVGIIARVTGYLYEKKMMNWIPTSYHTQKSI